MSFVKDVKMYIGKRIEIQKAHFYAVKKGMRGYVKLVENGILIVECDDGRDVKIYPEKDDFFVIQENPMKALIISPEKRPRIVNIDKTLDTLQKIVGGLIDEIYTDDNAVIIINDEGKINGMRLNRAIFDEDGNVVDIIAGTFIVSYAPEESESLVDIPDKILEKYQKKFYYPEQFFIENDEIVVVKTF